MDEDLILKAIEMLNSERPRPLAFRVGFVVFSNFG
jgi:hypothetical protein